MTIDLEKMENYDDALRGGYYTPWNGVSNVIWYEQLGYAEWTYPRVCLIHTADSSSHLCRSSRIEGNELRWHETIRMSAITDPPRRFIKLDSAPTHWIDGISIPMCPLVCASDLSHHVSRKCIKMGEYSSSLDEEEEIRLPWLEMAQSYSDGYGGFNVFFPPLSCGTMSARCEKFIQAMECFLIRGCAWATPSGYSMVPIVTGAEKGWHLPHEWVLDHKKQWEGISGDSSTDKEDMYVATAKSSCWDDRDLYYLSNIDLAAFLPDQAQRQDSNTHVAGKEAERSKSDTSDKSHLPSSSVDEQVEPVDSGNTE